MLSDLKIAALSTPEELRKRLVEVDQENLDAFAASATDFGRISVVIHTIKTGEARSFRHKLRAISFDRRQYLEQEVKRSMSVGAISPADPGVFSMPQEPSSHQRKTTRLGYASTMAMSTHRLKRIFLPATNRPSLADAFSREVLRLFRFAYGFSSS